MNGGAPAAPFFVFRSGLRSQGAGMRLRRLDAVTAERALQHIKLGAQQVHLSPDIVGQHFARDQGDMPQLGIQIGFADDLVFQHALR